MCICVYVCVCVDDRAGTFLLLLLLCLSCGRREIHIDVKGYASRINICISISVNLYICVYVCICMHVLMTEKKHSDCVVCVGVVWLDSGRHRPCVFSFAHTLLFGTLSLKIFG